MEIAPLHSSASDFAPLCILGRDGMLRQMQREKLPMEISFLFLFPEENKFAKVEKGTSHIMFFR